MIAASRKALEEKYPDTNGVPPQTIKAWTTAGWKASAEANAIPVEVGDIVQLPDGSGAPVGGVENVGEQEVVELTANVDGVYVNSKTGREGALVGTGSSIVD